MLPRPRSGPPGIRRLCFVADIERYSRQPHPAQIDLQQRLSGILRDTTKRASLSAVHTRRQDQGDGQLIVLPPGIDEATALPALLGGLTAAVEKANADATVRLRLRAALSQGVIHVAATGFVGRSVVAACRLLDSQVLRSTLDEHPDADVAVAVTDDLFADVVSQDYPGLPSATFRRAEVATPSKDFAAVAWVHVADGRRIPPPPPVGLGPLGTAALAGGASIAGAVAGGAAAWYHEPLHHDPPDHHDHTDDYPQHDQDITDHDSTDPGHHHW